MWNIVIEKDGNWFLAKVIWHDNLFAYWDTKELAKKELLWVVEMVMDFHLTKNSLI